MCLISCRSPRALSWGLATPAGSEEQWTMIHDGLLSLTVKDTRVGHQGMWMCIPGPVEGRDRHNEVIRSVSISKLRPNPSDFPGGPVAKNPPASVSDMGLIPGPGRFHVLRGN
ncbi:hypothetical protein MJT46_011723 [Ovis ammon polii x Ovis aries]|nr:hypothetical protein MJT46_011723 [Ovis ammon polii x Ovis aries]